MAGGWNWAQPRPFYEESASAMCVRHACESPMFRGLGGALLSFCFALPVETSVFQMMEPGKLGLAAACQSVGEKKKGDVKLGSSI